jgi:glutathione synthase/RimK-type ligase-like ATP-grasp enzyme
MPVVVRPRGIKTTPRALAEDLDWTTRAYPNRSRLSLDYRTDFFMAPVAPEFVRNAPAGYTDLYHFLSRNKYAQRKALAALGLPTPRTVGSHTQARELFGDGRGRFVVRPMRHSGGQGYRVTEIPTDFVEGQEYLSELYPKKREYRVVFVFGNPRISLRKKPHGETPEESPWGHANSRFQTINNTAESRLAQTDFYWRAAHCPLVRSAHILALDILYNERREDDPYVVLEANTCPGLTIDDNRTKIVEAIQARN